MWKVVRGSVMCILGIVQACDCMLHRRRVEPVDGPTAIARYTAHTCTACALHLRLCIHLYRPPVSGYLGVVCIYQYHTLREVSPV